jgi:hypothetical protein
LVGATAAPVLNTGEALERLFHNPMTGNAPLTSDKSYPTGIALLHQPGLSLKSSLLLFCNRMVKFPQTITVDVGHGVFQKLKVN